MCGGRDQSLSTEARSFTLCTKNPFTILSQDVIGRDMEAEKLNVLIEITYMVFEESGKNRGHRQRYVYVT